MVFKRKDYFDERIEVLIEQDSSLKLLAAFHYLDTLLNADFPGQKGNETR